MNQKTTLSKIRGGHISKQSGIAFESCFFLACQRAGFKVIRLPQGAVARKSFKGIQFVPVKMPFDFIVSTQIAMYPTAAFIDTKSISAENVSYSFLTDHQVDELHDLELCGHVAGYLVHFKSTNKVVFFTASLLKSLKPRESLKPEQGRQLGDAFNLNLEGFL